MVEPALPAGGFGFVLGAFVFRGISMFNALSDAEIACHHVELLPARTVLSMRSNGIQDILGGNSGNGGDAGGAGKSPMDLFALINHPGVGGSQS